MSTESPVPNIAVIGAGLIGERHARLIAGTDGVSLSAIVDPSQTAADLAEHLASTHFATLDDFLEYHGTCDGVIIATPNETHRELALACIENGIACLIEKPLAANSKDALAIVEASEKQNMPVLVGHHRRHHAVSHRLKQMIAEGRLGELVGAQLVWALKKPDDYFTAGDWRVREGGGPVWINLIHEIDLLRYFIGEITEVSAMLSNVTRENSVEDSGVISLRFSDGAIASIFISDCTPSPWHFEGGSGENPNIAKTGKDGLRVFGTHGSASFPSLTIWKHADESGHWGEAIHSQKEPVAASMDGEAALTNQLENFRSVIRGEAAPLVSARDGLQTVRVVEAIHKAAKTGSNVSVEAM